MSVKTGGGSAASRRLYAEREQISGMRTLESVTARSQNHYFAVAVIVGYNRCTCGVAAMEWNHSKINAWARAVWNLCRGMVTVTGQNRNKPREGTEHIPNTAARGRWRGRTRRKRGAEGHRIPMSRRGDGDGEGGGIHAGRNRSQSPCRGVRNMAGRGKTKRGSARFKVSIEGPGIWRGKKTNKREAERHGFPTCGDRGAERQKVPILRDGDGSEAEQTKPRDGVKSHIRPISVESPAGRYMRDKPW